MEPRYVAVGPSSRSTLEALVPQSDGLAGIACLFETLSDKLHVGYTQVAGISNMKPGAANSRFMASNQR